MRLRPVAALILPSELCTQAVGLGFRVSGLRPRFETNAMEVIQRPVIAGRAVGAWIGKHVSSRANEMTTVRRLRPCFISRSEMTAEDGYGAAGSVWPAR
jgi:hypothetical protein